MAKVKDLNHLIVFLVVGGLHAAALFLFVFTMNTPIEEENPSGGEVVRLIDIDEAPAPPPPKVQLPSQQNVSEALAENFVETETNPDTVTAGAVSTSNVAVSGEDYLPQSKISIPPRFNEKEIISKLVYPPIAQRSGIDEGRVILELFVNQQGVVTRINLLKEEPEGRGFGEAAVRAFSGLRGSPAEANGKQVAARYRYPVRFQLR